MGVYKDRRDYVDHDFNTTTLTIDGEHKAEGLEMIEVEKTEDDTTVKEAADGLGIFVVRPSKSGTIKFQILEASATNDIMWALRSGGSSFSVSVLDVAAPELDCNAAKARISKAPVVKRGIDHDMVEWTLIAVYLDVKGGSYSLASA